MENIEKNQPFSSFEILFQLYGFEGDGDPFAVQNSSLFDSEILEVSRDHQDLQQILIPLSTCTDEFSFTIYKVISDVLKETYIQDLSSLESQLETLGFCNFNVLTKYHSFFKDILKLVGANSKDCQLLFQIINLLKEKYLINYHLENDPLYQQIFCWMTKGKLSIEQGNSFFILSSSCLKNTVLDLSRVPSMIDPLNVIKIYNIGKMIRKMDSNGVKINFSDPNLFWKYYLQREQIYDINLLFKRFLADISNNIFRQIMDQTTLKNDYISFIKQLQTFYLHGNELFWTNFHEILKNSNNNDARIAFTKALYITFDDNEADSLIHKISVKETNDKFKIQFHIPNLLKIFKQEKTVAKYQLIFEFLQKFQTIRLNLLEYWQEYRRQNERPIQRWFLLYSLIRFTGIFYCYSKLCIQHRMDQFFANFHTVIDIDEINRMHETALLGIISDLFIKNTFNLNLLNKILDLCHEIIKHGDAHQLFKEFNQAIEIFTETVQINKYNSSPFNEFLFCI